MAQIMTREQAAALIQDGDTVVITGSGGGVMEAYHTLEGMSSLTASFLFIANVCIYQTKISATFLLLRFHLLRVSVSMNYVCIIVHAQLFVNQSRLFLSQCTVSLKIL